MAHHAEADDGTHKLLLRLGDDQLIECVLIQEEDRRTACISTQVGCGMGCVFCASGLNGRGPQPDGRGNPRTAHPPAQPAALPTGRLTHIVVMGMGEPLANLDALLAALEVAGAGDGLGIGARHVTISTVGLPAKIRRLADLGKQYHLAVSLHAPNDALRTASCRPTTRPAWQAILEAADYFHQRTGRQVTYEYVLLHGINDSVGPRPGTGPAAAGPAGPRQPDPVQRRGGSALPAPTDQALTAFVGCAAPGGTQRQGAQAQRLGHRRRLRPIAAPGGNHDREFSAGSPRTVGDRAG